MYAGFSIVRSVRCWMPGPDLCLKGHWPVDEQQPLHNVLCKGRQHAEEEQAACRVMGKELAQSLLPKGLKVIQEELL